MGVHWNCAWLERVYGQGNAGLLPLRHLHQGVGVQICQRARQAKGPDPDIAHPQVPQLHLFTGNAALPQIVPQQGGVLLRSTQVQLIAMGFHGQLQVVHRRAVVDMGLNRKSFLLIPHAAVEIDPPGLFPPRRAV